MVTEPQWLDWNVPGMVLHCVFVKSEDWVVSPEWGNSVACWLDSWVEFCVDGTSCCCSDLVFCSCLKCPKWQSVALQKYVYMAVHHQCFDGQFTPLSAVHQYLMSSGTWHNEWFVLTPFIPADFQSLETVSASLLCPSGSWTYQQCGVGFLRGCK